MSAFGPELITNGDMELDSSWTDYNTPTQNVQSSAQSVSPTHSRLFTVDSSDDGIKSTQFTTVTDATYQLALYAYPDDGTVVSALVREGDNSGWAINTQFTGLTQDAWNLIEVEFTTEGGAFSQVFIVGGATSGDWYIDDVSIKEILSTDATTSTLQLSPSGWAINTRSTNASTAIEIQAAPGAGRNIGLKEINVSTDGADVVFLTTAVSAGATASRILGPLHISATKLQYKDKFIKQIVIPTNKNLMVSTSAATAINIYASGTIK